MRTKTNKNRNIGYVLMLWLLIVTLSFPALAAYNGIQPIGFSAYSASDVDKFADTFKRVGGDLEIRLLPHQFNPSNPYTNIDRFVKRVLPGLNGRLRVVIYPYNKTHFPNCGDTQSFDYNAFGGQTDFRNFYLNNRITPMNNWVKQIYGWAASQNLQNKLSFKVAPVLEDTWTGSANNFTQIFGAINYRQVNTNQVPVDISEFRSANGGITTRIGSYRLELHGKFSDVSGYLQTGDMYSNDGTDVSDTQFMNDQKSALRRGIDVAWWIPEFNNKTQNADPCRRTFAFSSSIFTRTEAMLRAR